MVFFKFLDKTKPEQVKEAAKKAETAVEQANTPVVIKEEIIEPVKEELVKEELTVDSESIITPELEIQADVADQNENEEVVENTISETIEEPSEVENEVASEIVEENKEKVPEVNETVEEQPETAPVEDAVEETSVEDAHETEETSEPYDDCHTEAREKEVDGSSITLYELRNIIVEAVDYIFDRILTVVEKKVEEVKDEEKD